MLAPRLSLTTARTVRNVSRLGFQRSAPPPRARLESQHVRRERYTVTDVSKAVPVRRAELQLVLVARLEREAKMDSRSGRIEAFAELERHAVPAHRPPEHLRGRLLRFQRRAVRIER